MRRTVGGGWGVTLCTLADKGFRQAVGRRSSRTRTQSRTFLSVSSGFASARRRAPSARSSSTDLTAWARA